MRIRIGAIGEKISLFLLRNGPIALFNIISLVRWMKRDIFAAIPWLFDIARVIEFRLFVSQPDEPIAVEPIVASFQCLRKRHFQR